MVDRVEYTGGFRSVPIPHLARGGRWRVEAMRSYDHARLIWFTRGQGRITISGVTRGYGPNNAIFLPPGTMHGFELSPQVFGTVIDFPHNYALDLPDRPIHLRVRDAVQQGEFMTHLDAFQRELLGDRPGRGTALSAHASLIVIWLRRQQAQGAGDTPPDDATRKLAVRYANLVERDVSAAKSVADYAAELGITPTHLSRVCNSANGRPAHSLLSGRVLAEARKMLSDSKVPIHSIAHELGYSSAAYFTRAFQRNTGVTPSRFRRRSGAGPENSAN